MRRGYARRTHYWVAGFAAAGVLGAHFVAYLLAVPDPHTRRSALEASGHRYWSLVVAAVIVALAASLVMLAQHVAHRDRASDRVGRFSSVVLRLLGLQVVGFVALEGAERAFVAAHPVSELIAEPAFLIGVALQIAVAFVGALVILAFTRVVELACGRRRGVSRSEAAPAWRPYEISLAPSPVASRPAAPRAPPRLLLTEYLSL